MLKIVQNKFVNSILCFKYAIGNKTVEAVAVREGTAYRYGPSSTVLCKCCIPFTKK